MPDAVLYSHEATPAIAALDYLRSSTQQKHRDLESIPPLTRLFATDYTLAEYTALLKSFLTILEPLEYQLKSNRLLDFNDYYYRPRCPDITCDLMSLAASSYHEAILVPQSLLQSPASAIGCLYVLEGSRLGGRQIARHLEISMELTKEHGLTFFYGRPQTGASSWKCFCMTAEKICQSHSAINDAIESAEITFDIFNKVLRDD